VDNEVFILDDIPGPSSTHFKPNRGYDEFVSEKFTIVFDKCKVCGRNAVHILIATAEALSKNVNKLIINWSSIRRAPMEHRKERT